MIKERNPWLVLILSLVTFGIYSIYWIVVTTNELKELGQDTPNPWLLLAMLVPIVNIFVGLYYFWMYTKAVEGMTGGQVNGILLFLIWILFSPAAMVWIQMELNKKAGGAAPVQPAQPAQPTA